MNRTEHEPGASCTHPHEVGTYTFEWGMIKWLVGPDRYDGAKVTFGEVVLLPGKGHARHNHPTSEEILYVIAGEGRQMVSDGEPYAIAAGDTIYVPLGAFHSTLNTGWLPLRLIAMYNPAGAEAVLRELPDFREAAPGEIVDLVRA